MRHHLASTSGTARLARTRFAVAGATLLVALLVALAVAPASATPLADKQAQAAELDREVGKLEEKYSGLQERWRGALVELREIQTDVAETREQLRETRADLRDAKARLSTRALDIYQDGAGNTQLLEVAKAGTIGDFFDRLETIERVGEQDADIVSTVRTLAERVERQEERLEAAHDRQEKVVQEAATAKRRMGKVLAERQAALASVTAEVRAIMARQRAAEAARSTADARRLVETITSGGSAPSGGGDGGGGGGGSTDSSGGGSDNGGASVPLPPASGSASAAASIAMGKVGAPYVYGAAGPDSFDCSGLVVWAFAQAGRPGLPHSTYSLIGMGVEVPYDQAQVGDLVFTNNSGHMGIYVGGGSFVHSPRTGRTVTVEGLGYYSIVSIRRI